MADALPRLPGGTPSAHRPRPEDEHRDALPAGSLVVAGLFAGIGGIEVGLHRAGHRTAMLCEIDRSARAVLEAHFPAVPVEHDVCAISELPAVDMVAAGFPCQDLSQAGRTAGIQGAQSGLVSKVLRLMERSQATWLLLENVSFMLQLDSGGAMAYLTRELDSLGFSWAYRVVDTRAFGLPQRRQRVILLASRSKDPRRVLFADDAGPFEPKEPTGLACGFYWTEGVRGLGWAVDAVPTLKGGSTIGIPSPPGIVLPDGSLVVPDIRGAERLQGFDADWTLPATSGGKRRGGPRWKLVGNAVSVPVAAWVGQRLVEPGEYDGTRDLLNPVAIGQSWPRAAWGAAGQAFAADVSTWPVRNPYPHLQEFLAGQTSPLSIRAIRGFQDRMKRSSLRFPPVLVEAVEAHLLLNDEAAA